MAAPAHSITTPKISPVSRRAALFGVAAAGLSPALEHPPRAEGGSLEAAYAEFKRLDVALDADPADPAAAVAAALRQAEILLSMEATTLREFAIQAEAIVFTGKGFADFVVRLAGVAARYA